MQKPVIERVGGTQLRENRISHDNQVESVIDGRNYVSRWFAELDRLDGASRSGLFHSGWRLDDVGPDGRYTSSGRTVVAALAGSRRSGTDVFVRLSGHGMGMSNARIARRLHKVEVPTVVDRHLRSVSASQHEKFSLFLSSSCATAMTGSIDLSRTRWDTQSHDIVSTSRYTVLRQPSHDTGVVVTGTAAADMAAVFESLTTEVERSRRPSARLPASKDTNTGSTVQVLRTVPVEREEYNGFRECSIANAYFNALATAQRFVYIEDQYFWPMFPKRPAGLEVDLLDCLLGALRRGVSLYIVLPSPRLSNPIGRLQARVRHSSMMTLANAQDRRSGSVFFATPVRNRRPVYVHSKLLIADDEYALIGSANVNARSMFFDGELSVGIHDRHVVSDLRARVWEEHLGVGRDRLRDDDSARSLFEVSLRSRRGHLRPYRHPTGISGLNKAELAFWTKVVDQSGQVL